ncbi:MAG: GNAT family protein [Peptostreptococcaceae bacterium]|nr:GNAT family protein [Peptostreptococcaceae bacterium]MDY5739678.1 GNAT family protein [Anaerovoracaceae bacterium]SFE10957.1 Protein N-acetyltransferase, RimJ/RimL family [Peptostreptococcaceae bacterium pGA-8]
MESKNLIIRHAVFEDCRYFAQWEVMPEVTEFFTMDEGLTYEDVVTEFIKCKIDPSKEIFTICLKETDEPIGKLFITNINDKCDSLDITRIYIAPKLNRGKGYGEEALRLFLEYAFINMHRERVTLDYMTKNIIAQQLYQKIGFKREGTMRNSGKKNGKYLDLILMSMLRADYYESIHDR